MLVMTVTFFVWRFRQPEIKIEALSNIKTVKLTISESVHRRRYCVLRALQGRAWQPT